MISIRQILLFCSILIAVFTTVNAFGQTTVWIVRHAEINTKTPSADPVLSIDGQDRAKELSALLRPHRVLAVYAAATNRSKQTAQPLAYGRGLTTQVYDPADLADFVAAVLRAHKNGSVVIVADANMVIPLVEAFGIKSPVPSIDDHYDYVFTLNVQGNAVQVQASQYGKLHRTAVQK